MFRSLKVFIIINYSLLIIHYSQAQPLSSKHKFTYADTLRGSNGPGRNWWDVKKYDIRVKINLEDSTITGTNSIEFKSIKKGVLMQLDLQEPMIIDSMISWIDNKPGAEKFKVVYSKEGNAYFFLLHPEMQNKLWKIGQHGFLTIYYHGKPQIAKRPPWDGGLIWKRSKDGSPWISIACQGLGASVWYPCKDYQGDEPDEGSFLEVTVPDSLTVVSNGNYSGLFKEKKPRFWKVKNPINNYNIIPYIGKYKNFNETYKGEKGDLKVDYWVLEENIDKAREQFKEVPRMLKAFEHWFGPFPFYEDGFKLVEAPHLGMEHQSAIAYGNGFQNGYRGRDLSGSGWGLKWDFIIVHESGHEWWGNNITTNDIADMWVHESFTNYSETLFTDYHFGKEAGNAYVQGTRKNIQNDIPIIGPYGVNKEGSGDMYYKGGNMLHTIRQIINDDEKFRQILRGLNKTFYHKTINGSDVEKYISKTSKIDFSKVFDQYLRTIKIPLLEYKINKNTFSYRWANVVNGFKMPVKMKVGDNDIWITPTQQWQSKKITQNGDTNSIKPDANFYIESKNVN